MADNKVKNNVRVSTSKSLFFYTNLAKRLLAEGEEVVELSGLGTTVNAVVCIEILKGQNLVEVTKIVTSLEGTNGPNVPKLQVYVKKGPEFEKYVQQLESRKAEEKKE
eukprot:NODE_10380_length_520_cov_17.780856_g9732_i0.p1 GENE.NODE_10380_length_520_cov_17.780856_g9732_i0~~NODE_10380_length_520_cov_17.780856_g9732_i0.p1  ORF type:complete len:108 (+),score=23.60 NODE_10380_length_520_cov_17.780856_g9732_i0:62-385(+)